MYSSEMINKKIGTYLKEKRIEANLSQKQVADKLRYSSPQFISNFERGLCSPPMPALRSLIRLYKIDVDELTQFILKLQEKHFKLIFGIRQKTKSNLKLLKKS